MVTEFWDGWFDHWGEEHHTQSADTAAATMEDILKFGASVNLYMFHGLFGAIFCLNSYCNSIFFVIEILQDRC